MLPASLDQVELDGNVAPVVSEASSELVGIAAHHPRAVFGDDPLDPVGVDRFEIGDVADDLPRRPGSGYGDRVDLVRGHSPDRLPQEPRPVEVLSDQIFKGHRAASSWKAAIIPAAAMRAKTLGH